MSQQARSPLRSTEVRKDTNLSNFLRLPIVEEMETEEERSRAQPSQSARGKQADPTLLLTSLLERECALGEAATKEVVFSPPLISRLESGIIGRGTINIIQGAYGSHKSRLAETLAALMLTTNDTHDSQFMDFKRAVIERFCVCYIDTERNQSEELPFAVQQIKLKAGFLLADKPESFRFTSIKHIERKQRFAAIDAFIGHVRQSTSLHLFALIDVVTDAIGDFNDSEETMKLFDFLGNLCDRHNATFLLVIHQNPGTDKARGHTGTEAANKASSVLQIGFEKDSNGVDSELIRLRFLKLRRGKRPDPIYLRYCDQAKGLVLADAAQVAEHINQRKHKADVQDMADRLTSLLSEGPVPKGSVVDTLMTEFSSSNRTIRERLRTMMEQGIEMYNEEGKPARLADCREGKNEYYKMEPIG
ncbi:AAA family ATPase [Spirosoma utsteinense]|uniref:AAA family ATPase n=1 Tax=Spirosoma utsteinense TaxID=2585773 RepID=A0ABR6W2K8_9BACT|nr:AAA family ATPase [Spirosoma utsteinense]MBC3784948.1 hypothetical protein [Spirosoma utsteinense]MBC3790444.1 hypothetical protein [Spirosoma utsteinense]